MFPVLSNFIINSQEPLISQLLHHQDKCSLVAKVFQVNPFIDVQPIIGQFSIAGALCLPCDSTERMGKNPPPDTHIQSMELEHSKRQGMHLFHQKAWCKIRPPKGLCGTFWQGQKGMVSSLRNGCLSQSQCESWKQNSSIKTCSAHKVQV